MRDDAQRRADVINEAKRQRRNAYPDIGEQMDMLWHAMNTGAMPKVEPFYSTIKAVKDSVPKPGVE